jgi:hypothetical protein
MAEVKETQWCTLYHASIEHINQLDVCCCHHMQELGHSFVFAFVVGWIKVVYVGSILLYFSCICTLKL